jgi:hypothetical protein
MMAGTLRPGDLVAFRTSPVTNFNESPTDRHTALNVLRVGEFIVYTVLDGVFTERPT